MWELRAVVNIGRQLLQLTNLRVELSNLILTLISYIVIQLCLSVERLDLWLRLKYLRLQLLVFYLQIQKQVVYLLVLRLVLEQLLGNGHFFLLLLLLFHLLLTVFGVLVSIGFIPHCKGSFKDGLDRSIDSFLIFA